MTKLKRRQIGNDRRGAFGQAVRRHSLSGQCTKPLRSFSGKKAGWQSDLRPYEQHMLATGRVNWVVFHVVPLVWVPVSPGNPEMPLRHEKRPF
jgi:hypothetical protein